MRWSATVLGLGLVAFRDPHGIRPLVLGKRTTTAGDEYAVASESVALDVLGFERVRDVAPGRGDGDHRARRAVHARCAPSRSEHAPCIFEYVYFARPDSMMDDISVHKARMRMGVKLGEKILRLRPDHDIDAVIPIPDTSRDAALEIANVLGVKYREGFIKNRYVGRTFIMPGQGERVKSVRRKLNPIPLEFRNRVVLLVDDSIVRGTTSQADRADGARRRRAQGLPRLGRAAGALSRTSTASTCRRPTNWSRTAAARKKIEKLLGCDWLIYQDLADLEAAVAGPKHPDRSSSTRPASTANTSPASSRATSSASSSCARTRPRRSARVRREPRLAVPADDVVVRCRARRASTRRRRSDKLARDASPPPTAFAARRAGDRPTTRRAPEPIRMPGRPARPRLVHPRDLPQRGLGSAEGRAAFIHAIAHIEFNAIDLAWDAVYRFRGMPRAFYADWVGVADDEARHFALLRARLRELGHDYGDFDAHNGLWEMAEKTAHDGLARMALVPRVLEARGLDVTPGHDREAARARRRRHRRHPRVILREEVAHVAAGSRWFRWYCERAGVEPRSTFRELLAEVRAAGAARAVQPRRRAARRVSMPTRLAALEQLAVER